VTQRRDGSKLSQLKGEKKKRGEGRKRHQIQAVGGREVKQTHTNAENRNSSLSGREKRGVDLPGLLRGGKGQINRSAQMGFP